MGAETIYPSTGNRYSFKESLVFVSIGSFMLGALQGWAEAVWLQKLFRHKPLWYKLLLKGIYYSVFLMLFLSIISLTLNAYYLNTHPFDAAVLETYFAFIGKFPFWSITLYTAVILAIALFFSEVNLYLGAGVLRNFFMGKYHRPKKEIRIFMFLDMKSSTSIAEALGHEIYFDFLKLYYAHMTDAILETFGEIYQYVGDEIVVSWPKAKGIQRGNCILCFELISKTIAEKKELYLSKFGVLPEFKAGYHVGEVTTGEIGIIKKDIIYTGDILNTAARIQAECNNYDAKVLLSGQLAEALAHQKRYRFTEVGKPLLRGKQTPVRLFKSEL